MEVVRVARLEVPGVVQAARSEVQVAAKAEARLPLEAGVVSRGMAVPAA